MIDVIFAHCDAPLPEDFHFELAPPVSDTPRLWQKWKSRRMAHFLLSQLFEKHGLAAAQLKQIERTPSGRPYLPNSEIDFNISHSGQWIALIFSRSFTKSVVGIDVEHPQKPRRFEALLRHYANTEELEGLLPPAYHPLPDLASRFYLSWCLREAILKTQGIGIVKLSEVRHLPASAQILSAHCPQGWLAFYPQLPCFMAYFWQKNAPTPTLWQWTGNLQKIEQIQPLIYAVNQEKGTNYA